MGIAVIGSGYVGLVSAVCFAEIGHDVVSVDNDSAKIAALERGEVPIHEHHLPELLKRHRGGRLRFSTSIEKSVKDADAVFIGDQLRQRNLSDFRNALVQHVVGQRRQPVKTADRHGDALARVLDLIEILDGERRHLARIDAALEHPHKKGVEPNGMAHHMIVEIEKHLL